MVWFWSKVILAMAIVGAIGAACTIIYIGILDALRDLCSEDIEDENL